MLAEFHKHVEVRFEPNSVYLGNALHIHISSSTEPSRRKRHCIYRVLTEIEYSILRAFLESSIFFHLGAEAANIIERLTSTHLPDCFIL